MRGMSQIVLSTAGFEPNGHPAAVQQPLHLPSNAYSTSYPTLLLFSSYVTLSNVSETHFVVFHPPTIQTQSSFN